jgi:hypothetical protein
VAVEAVKQRGMGLAGRGACTYTGYVRPGQTCELVLAVPAESAGL